MASRSGRKKAAKAKKGGAKVKARPLAPGMSELAVAQRDYISMLSDPCRGPIVRAPYGGVGSSYVIRTTDMFQITVTGTNTSYVDFAWEYTPWNAPTVQAVSVTTSGGSGAVVSGSVNNFITNTTVVKAYRPVAACVKVTPTGTYSGRAGVIGLSYSPNKQLKVGDTISPSTLLGQQQRVATNGSEQHEVLWLPSFGDERLATNGEANVNGVGSIIVVGRNIDAVAGVNSTANVIIEATTIWEWVPCENNSSTGTGISDALGKNLGMSLNEALRPIKDFGKFVFHNVGAGMAAGGMAYLSRPIVRRGTGPSIAY